MTEVSRSYRKEGEVFGEGLVGKVEVGLEFGGWIVRFPWEENMERHERFKVGQEKRKVCA